MLEKDYSRPNKSVMPQEELTVSKMGNSSHEASARTRLQEYKQFINKLDTIQEEKPFQKNKQNSATQNWKEESHNWQQ